MAKLYDIKTAIQRVIDQRHLDTYETFGAIGLKAGLLIGFIKPDTPDDPVKIEKLRAAVKTVLGVSL